MPGFPDWLSQQVMQGQLFMGSKVAAANGDQAFSGVPSWATGIVWVATPTAPNVDFDPFYLEVRGLQSQALYIYPSVPGAGGAPMSVSRPLIAHSVVSAVDTDLTAFIGYFAGGAGHHVTLSAYAVVAVPDMPIPPVRVAAPGSALGPLNLIAGAGQSVYSLVGASMAVEAPAGSNAAVQLTATVNGAPAIVAKLVVTASGYMAADFDLHEIAIDPGTSVVYSSTGPPVDAVPSLYFRQLV